MEQVTEKRRYPRHNVVSAVMVAPNGDQHGTQLLDLSMGGARVGLPEDWTPSDGLALRLYFLADGDDGIVLAARVTRVAIDHLGLEFASGQEAQIQQLLDVLCHCR